jgi:4-hydroxy-tetrahydrodipicolinate synthase
MAFVESPAMWLAGYIADLPTPFDENDEIDLVAFAKLCERQIKAGVTAIVVGETAGEATNLTLTEHDAIVRAAVRIARGRIRVIAGAGSNSTGQAVELTRRAEAAGADAVLSVAPYYNKPTQSGISAHYQAIAATTSLPIVLHDIPSRTARGLSDDTIAKLAESGQFIGLKDATCDVARPGRLRPSVRPEFQLLSGDDTTAIAFLSCGGDGCISVISNIVPDLCQAIYSSCKQGRFQIARQAAVRLAPLTDSFSRDDTPASLKYALSLLGLISPGVRLPIVELNAQSKAEIASAVTAICNAREAGLRSELH